MTMLHFTSLENSKNGGGMQNLWSSFIRKDERLHLVGIVFRNTPVIQVNDAKID